MKPHESWTSVFMKVLISFFLVLAAAAAAWSASNALSLADEREARRRDEERLKEIGKIAPVVKEMAEAGYTAEKLREERRTGNWVTFFANTAKAAGLARNQYKLPARKTAPGKGYMEHYFEIRITPKTGVTRQTIARFLWSVEKRRTYLKTKSIDIKRSGEGDDWGGTLTIAYREKQ